ncbi:Dual specificity protein kinase splA [Chlorella vulgaris]
MNSTRDRNTQVDNSSSGYTSDAFEDDVNSSGPLAVSTRPASSVSRATPRPAGTVNGSNGGASRSSTQRPSSRIGYLASTAAMEAKRPASGSRTSSRPSSASQHRQQQQQAPRPCSASPVLGCARDLEARVSKQMGRDPAEWTVREVCDWLELIGLGQWRRAFVHNAVSGALLLRLSSEELKTELGMAPLGHRDGLLTAVNDLEQYWRQQLGQQPGGGAGGQAPQGPASRPASPGAATMLAAAAADISLQRAYAQRARLLRELDKAESREALRRVAAEKALRVVGQASDEVRKLQASICELDRELGWEAAAEGQLCRPLDAHGALAWQPAGKQRAAQRPLSPGSPTRRPCSPGGGCAGSAMSRVSRRIMDQRGPEGGSFLDRLSSDLAVRQAKAAKARKRAGRSKVEAKEAELAAALRSDDPQRVAEACDSVAVSFQQEWALGQEVVAAVRRLSSPAKKAARLAGALRSAQFMQRLESDLRTREARLQQLQDKFFKLEAGNSAEQQEKADLAAARNHFSQLGWPAASLQAAPGDATAASDGLLGALLKRAAALQEARQWGRAVDWEQPDWKTDGLEDLQQTHNDALRSALEAQAQAAEAAEQQAGGARRDAAARAAAQQPKELLLPADRLSGCVELLAGCRSGEVELLQGLRGHRKLIMTWRAVRAQQFVAFTRQDLELRKAKAAALEREVYPDHSKGGWRRLAVVAVESLAGNYELVSRDRVLMEMGARQLFKPCLLRKEEYEAFFDRLMADTARRAQHRIAFAALAVALLATGCNVLAVDDDPCATACQSKILSQPKKPETDTASGIAAIFGDVLDVLTDWVPGKNIFRKIGLGVVTGIVDRSAEGDASEQALWAIYNLNKDLVQLQDWLACKLDTMARDIMFSFEQQMNQQALDGYNTAINAIEEQIAGKCGAQNCIALKDVPPRQRNTKTRFANDCATRASAAKVAACANTKWNPDDPKRCPIGDKPLGGVCDEDGYCYDVYEDAEWYDDLEYILDLFTNKDGIDDFNKFTRWMDVKATIALAKGATLKILVLQHIIMASGSRAKNTELVQFANNVAEKLQRRVDFHLNKDNLEKVVRAYTNPLDTNYQDRMQSMEWPQASEGQCKRDPPTNFCFLGLCTYTFEYASRFPTSSKIKMNQWVRWSCEKDSSGQYVNATLIKHECNLMKNTCDGDISGALRGVMDCNGNYFQCGWYTEGRVSGKEHCGGSYARCIDHNGRYGGQWDFMDLATYMCAYDEKARSGIAQGVDLMLAEVDKSLVDVKAIIASLRQLATIKGMPSTSFGIWRTSLPPLLNCTEAQSLKATLAGIPCKATGGPACTACNRRGRCTMCPVLRSYMKNGLCYPCPKNCSRCTPQTGVCTSCKKGYFLAAAQNSCLKALG